MCGATSLEHAIRDAREFCLECGSMCYVVEVIGGYFVTEWLPLSARVVATFSPERGM